ncbi:hypothetical protein MNBD_GAMMA09-924 [hydrothermal vent metagenome]|uniref:CheW-like domain-containing protein n=1 Tax=hydrothermal vent metagenome TaxID=652676 RepID=A0A3B0X9U8_9ZZZZ
MDNHIDNWLKPEDALNRFTLPQSSTIDSQGVSTEEAVIRYGFVIGNTGFLIAEDILSEIVKNTSIYPIPNTKNWMRGLINLRGNLVPVYDLNLLLGYSQGVSKYTNLLVLGKGSQSVGILIKDLPKSCETSQWKKAAHIPVHLSGLEEYVTEIYSSDDMIWLEFNHNAYFTSIKDQLGI